LEARDDPPLPAFPRFTVRPPRGGRARRGQPLAGGISRRMRDSHTRPDLNVVIGRRTVRRRQGSARLAGAAIRALPRSEGSPIVTGGRRIPAPGCSARWYIEPAPPDARRGRRLGRRTRASPPTDLLAVGRHQV